ncbi:MAG: hypothetical protein H7A34_03300 [bacterium]|nr:hypothetical protein [bacterium]
MHRVLVLRGNYRASKRLKQARSNWSVQMFGRIFGEVQRLMENRAAYDEMARAINPCRRRQAAAGVLFRY